MLSICEVLFAILPTTLWHAFESWEIVVWKGGLTYYSQPFIGVIDLVQILFLNSFDPPNVKDR